MFLSEIRIGMIDLRALEAMLTLRALRKWSKAVAVSQFGIKTNGRERTLRKAG